MPIEPIGGFQEPVRKPDSTKRDDTKRVETGKTQASSADSVSFSREAIKAAEVATYVEEIEKMPDIREEEVAQAQERLDSEVLFDREVLKETARRILLSE